MSGGDVRSQIQVTGRLRSGVSTDEANVELDGIAKRIEAEHKETNEGVRASIEPFVTMTCAGSIEWRPAIHSPRPGWPFPVP